MLALLPALACACLLAGCGGGRTSLGSVTPASTLPRTLTPADDGRVYTMQVGQTVGLIVPDPGAPDPEVQGRSVELVEVKNIDASGRREWELRAVATGRTTLRAEGKYPYTITLEVQPRTADAASARRGPGTP